MSVSNYLDIETAFSGLSRADFIESLVEDGWNLVSDGKIEFLPVGDNGDYDWQTEAVSQAELFDIMKQKESNNEELGIAMHWSNSEKGFSLRIDKDATLSFSFFAGERILEDTHKIADVSWYLNKIVPAISKIARIESIRYEYIP